MAKISYGAKVSSKQLEGFFGVEAAVPEIVDAKE